MSLVHGQEPGACCPHAQGHHDWSMFLTNTYHEQYPGRNDCRECPVGKCKGWKPREKRGNVAGHGLWYYGTCGYCGRYGVVATDLDFDGERYTVKCHDRDGCTVRMTARAL